MHMLKADFEASLACGGWEDLGTFVHPGSAQYEHHKPSLYERASKLRGARCVSFAGLGKTPFCPGGWAVARCLASWEHYDGNPSMLPMVFLYGGDNEKL
jgi:hypothetical protein